MAKFGIGQAVRRVEDQRFVTGHGRYIDDINLPGQAYGALVLSPHAHARIKRVDTAKAKAAPGVLAVLTGADAAADKLGSLTAHLMPEDVGNRHALVNLYLHGFNTPHIYEYDSLTSEERWTETAEVILANPPCMSPKGGMARRPRTTIVIG